MLYKLFRIDDSFEIIFTPDRSESNTALVYMTALSYRRKMDKVGHILISDSEHIDFINTCKCLQSYKLLEFDILKSNDGGLITKDVLSQNIKDNTCLISISHMNNRGTLNPINPIGLYCHGREVPFHSDVSHTFCIYPIRFGSELDVITISFDYIGCSGSALIVRKDLIKGYNMMYMIPRKKPLNSTGIAFSIKKFLTNRKEKTKSVSTMGPKLMSYLSKKINIVPYEDYDNQTEKMLEIVLFNEVGYHILFSIVNENFDNRTLIDYLYKKKIQINEPDEIYVPRIIRKGLIRISFHEEITEQDIRTLANEIIKGIQLQLSKAEWESSKVS